MKKNCSRLVIGILMTAVLGSVLTLSPTAGLGQTTVERQSPWTRYEVILERNMFSRQRGFAQQRGDEPGQVAAVPNPESYLLLKGVVQENGQFIAFLEDTRSNSVLRLQEGAKVARGVIKSLTLDSIEYEFGKRTITVRIGQDLEGGFGAVTMTELMEYSDSPTGASQDATTEAPTGEEADILKQLMERRKQELGG